MKIVEVLNSPLTLLLVRLAVAAAAGHAEAQKRITLVQRLVDEKRDPTPAELDELFSDLHAKSAAIQSS